MCGSHKKKEKDVIVLEYKIAEVSVLKKMCHSKGICYNCFNKKDMTDYLSHIDTPKVVFSVMNTYLFPDPVIHNRFLEIINAHNSILPQHPGRNAEAWEIFDEDEKTAVTWHKVCAQVDGGGILLQELFDIPGDITAINLLALQNQVQLKTFYKVFDMVEARNFTFQEQQSYGTYPIHYSRDIPNGGELDLDWPISGYGLFSGQWIMARYKYWEILSLFLRIRNMCGTHMKRQNQMEVKRVLCMIIIHLQLPKETQLLN